MTTDEQLTERIRAAMHGEVAGLEPPRDLFEQLRARTGGRRLAVPSLGGLIAAGACAVAVVIAVVAVTSLSRAPTVPVSRVPAGTPAAVRAIVARVAELRRPQTPADRLPAAVLRTLAAQGHDRILSRYTRLAATVAGAPGAVRIYLVAYQQTFPGLPAARRLAPSATLTSVTVGPHPTVPGMVGSSVTAAGESLVIGGSGSQAAGTPAVVWRGLGLLRGVVPDGVARVKWVFRRYQGVSSRAQSRTVVPAIEGNVAVAPALPAGWSLATSTWYGALGGVIASFDDSQQLARQQGQLALEVAASERVRVAPALSHDFAVIRDRRPQLLPSAMLAQSVLSNLTLNVAQARFVPYSRPLAKAGAGRGLWVLPGSGGVCLVGAPLHFAHFAGSIGVGAPAEEPGFNEGCAFLDHRPRASTGNVVMSTGGRSPTITGLVPDTNTSVSILMAGGAVEVAPVVDNIYSITVHGRPLRILLRSATGQRVTVPAPSAGPPRA